MMKITQICYFGMLNVLLILMFSCSCINAATAADEVNLYTTKMTGYNRSLRPGLSPDTALNVYMAFYIVSINEFDETGGKFSVVGFYEIRWEDDRLSWNPASYGGLNRIYYSQSEVWVPQMKPVNTMKDGHTFGANDVKIRVSPSGETTWRLAEFLETSCSADITFYPFDVQICRIDLVQLGYYYEDLVLTPMLTKIGTEFYEENGIWEIKSTNVSATYFNTLHYITFEFVLKRRSGFFIVNMLLPILMMGFLNLFVFILPAESGERVGYSITLLLSISVFLTLISDTLPPTSQPQMPILSFILMSDLVMSSLTMCCTIVGLRFYHNEEDKVIPRYLQTFVNCLSCAKLKKRNKVQELESADEHNSIINVTESKEKQTLKKQTRKEEKTEIKDVTTWGKFSNILQREESDGTEVKMGTTWKQFAMYFDVFCFIFFAIWITVTNVVFLQKTVWRQDY
ncbi:hypothetical protein KUTeg_003441 [Tegillarca granosa]|uniref:Uncharacterized protein n=1 Tax=Tegillarca granosa TaxID=220873 RepID=A0ABQ9FM66_TEGGR|nr:hypothetical protein KUTeg_003441 [Tegillarca granosa]